MGTGDSGQGLKNWVARVLRGSFQFKDYRILYPSAPIRPYHLMNGQVSYQAVFALYLQFLLVQTIAIERDATS